jgi:putative phosphoesterase
MKIAIISDVHNNTVNLKKVLDYCAEEKIETLICCGDLADAETLDFMCDNFSEEIFYTFGNMDNDHLKNFEFVPEYKNAKLFKNYGETNLANKEIAFVHFPREAKELAETGKYNFVFFGHTHKPWEEMVGNCKILNPGNVTGDFYPPTFAVWNTSDDTFELIRIHTLK